MRDRITIIASICPEGEQYGLAVADISTGEIHAAQFTDPDDSTLKNELARFAPNEIYSNPGLLDSNGYGGVYPEPALPAAVEAAGG